MFVDLDWPLNASHRLSASAELLVLWRKMAPQQSAKFRTAFLVIFPTLRKDSVANYAYISTLFSPSIGGLDVLYNALNVS